MNGAVGGLSVHLQPGRQHAPDLGDLDDVYVDVGATNAEQVRAAGIDLLDPLALDRTVYQLGSDKLSGMAIQNRFGAAAVDPLHDLNRANVKNVMIAFATQQWTGTRGITRLLEELKPDELLFVGPLVRAAGQTEPARKTGSGIGGGRRAMRRQTCCNRLSKLESNCMLPSRPTRRPRCWHARTYRSRNCPRVRRMSEYRWHGRVRRPSTLMRAIWRDWYVCWNSMFRGRQKMLRFGCECTARTKSWKQADGCANQR